jgi:hypothetical protein
VLALEWVPGESFGPVSGTLAGAVRLAESLLPGWRVVVSPVLSSRPVESHS